MLFGASWQSHWFIYPVMNRNRIDVSFRTKFDFLFVIQFSREWQQIDVKKNCELWKRCVWNEREIFEGSLAQHYKSVSENASRFEEKTAYLLITFSWKHTKPQKFKICGNWYKHIKNVHDVSDTRKTMIMLM